MESDEVDIRQSETMIAGEPPNDLGMTQGDLPLEIGEIARPVIAFHDPLGRFESSGQPAPERRHHRGIRRPDPAPREPFRPSIRERHRCRRAMCRSSADRRQPPLASGVIIGRRLSGSQGELLGKAC
jgi:hypothetical protein